MKGNKNVTEKQTTMKHIKTWNLKKKLIYSMRKRKDYNRKEIWNSK
jgi:hypothetical protein